MGSFPCSRCCWEALSTAHCLPCCPVLSALHMGIVALQARTCPWPFPPPYQPHGGPHKPSSCFAAVGPSPGPPQGTSPANGQATSSRRPRPSGAGYTALSTGPSLARVLGGHPLPQQAAGVLWGCARLRTVCGGDPAQDEPLPDSWRVTDRGVQGGKPAAHPPLESAALFQPAGRPRCPRMEQPSMVTHGPGPAHGASQQLLPRCPLADFSTIP